MGRMVALLICMLALTEQIGAQFECPRDENDQCVSASYSLPGSCSTRLVCEFCQALVLDCPFFEFYEPVYGRCMRGPDLWCAVNKTAFSVALTTNITGPQDPVSAQQQLINYGNDYSATTAEYTVPDYATPDIFLFHLSAGVVPNKPLDARIKGLPVNVGLFMNSTEHGEDIVSRNMVLPVNESTSLRLTLEEGGSMQGAENRTAWAGFNINDYMNYTCAFGASRSEPFGLDDNTTDIYFPNTHVNCEDALGDDGIFVAPERGLYFLSFSSGVDALEGLTVNINVQGLENKTIQIRRSPIIDVEEDSITMISKSIVVWLADGDDVSIELVDGVCVNSPIPEDTLISFSGFRYNPIQPANFHAWSLHLNMSVSGAVDAVKFDVEDVNWRNTYSPLSGYVTIQVAGFYFMSLSVGIDAAPSVHAQIMRRNSIAQVFNLTDVYKTGHTEGAAGEYIDTVSRSIFVHLDTGDSIYVTVPDGSTIYSDSNWLTSFSGFLVRRFNFP